MAGAALIQVWPLSYQASATLAVSPAIGPTNVQITPAAAHTLVTNSANVAQMLAETGLAAEGWTVTRFLAKAVDVKPVPTTNLIKVHVQLPDPAKARAAASALAAKAVDLSRRLDSEAAIKGRETIAAQLTAAERGVKLAEDAIITYQMGAEIERLEAQIRATLDRSSRQVTAAAPELAARRAELYRKRIELHRREVEFDIRLRSYSDLKAKANQARAWPEQASQLKVVDAPGSAASPLPRPVAALAVIGALIGLVAGVAAALLLHRRRVVPVGV